MSITTPVEYEGLMLPEAFQLQERMSEYLHNDTVRRAVEPDWVEDDLVAVEDRIAHLTSLLTF